MGSVEQSRGVALVGTTASGKSAVCEEVARRLEDVDLLSMDAMSVYRGMDLATAKASLELRSEVPHHLIDLVDPSEGFSVADFQREARRALGEVARMGRRALLVGGTGLYLRAVVDDLELPGRYPDVRRELECEADRPSGTAALFERLGRLDPLAASRTTPSNRRRIVRALEVTLGAGRPFSSFGPGLESYPPTQFALVGMPFDPIKVDRRIAERFDRWLDDGLVEEVRRLAASPAGMSHTARQALGYRELLAHVEDRVPLDQCVDRALARTRRLARRQWSWFRRDPRIRWVPADGDPVQAVLEALGDARSTSRRPIDRCSPAARM